MFRLFYLYCRFKTLLVQLLIINIRLRIKHHITARNVLMEGHEVADSFLSAKEGAKAIEAGIKRLSLLFLFCACIPELSK